MKRESKTVAISEITPSTKNPRKDFNEQAIKELSESLKQHGMIQPISLINAKGGGYEILCGERRYRAAVMAGFEAVDCEVFSDLSKEQADQIRITENLQRKDISPVEEATAYNKLLKGHKMKIEDIAKSVSKSGQYIRQRLLLLNLSDRVSFALENNEIPVTAAVKISTLEKSRQVEVFDAVTSTESGAVVYMGNNQLNWYFENFVSVSLSKAEFDTSNKELFPDAGTCGACPKKAVPALGLFEDVAGHETCLDVKCFVEKQSRHYKMQAEDLSEKTDQDVVFATRQETKDAGQYQEMGKFVRDVHVLTEEEEKSEAFKNAAKPAVFVGTSENGDVPTEKKTGFVISKSKYDKIKGEKPTDNHDKGVLTAKLHLQYEEKIKKTLQAEVLFQCNKRKLPKNKISNMVSFFVILCLNSGKWSWQSFINLLRDYNLETLPYYSVDNHGEFFTDHIPIEKCSHLRPNDYTIFLIMSELTEDRKREVLKMALVNSFLKDEPMIEALLESFGLYENLEQWKQNAKEQHEPWFEKRKKKIENQ